jgi:hypothetical protein
MLRKTPNIVSHHGRAQLCSRQAHRWKALPL